MLTVLKVLQGLGGHPAPELDRFPVRGAVVDSRLAVPADLFVAIKGERSDGHAYVADAFRRGAVAALIEQEVTIPGATIVDARAGAATREALGGPPFLIRVDNTVESLQLAGAAWRAGLSPRVVGVTGSLGKSTTKELIAQVLSARYRTLKNEGNQNNELGIPITLLRLRPEHEYAVIEIGMYARGEIARFSSWARPQIGVVTMVAPVHLERLGSLDNIALAKAELVETLPAAADGGVAILNDDDVRVRAMASMTRARVVTAGMTSRADFWIEDIETRGLDGILVRLREKGVTAAHTARVPLLGAHSANTALRAAAVGRVAGLSWGDIVDALGKPGGAIRLQVLEGPHESIIIDDTYNASLESTLAALNVLQEVGDPPRVAVLADMLELADLEEAAHREVGCRAALVAQLIVCVGERARWIAEEARACGAPAAAVVHVATKPEAIRAVRERVTRKSTILVKGSRGMEMEDVVAGLQD
jgi:UDP-N-acetylmuramoyl-tripeptide--D-alanyl-D-alanine ligase